MFDVDELSKDDFLGGAIKIWQPKNGYRAGMDPILLAATVNVSEGQKVLDLGCGVGTASFAIGFRVKKTKLYGIEIQKSLVDLASRNSKENGIALKIECADILNLPSSIKNENFDHVIANPPYFDRKSSVSSKNLSKEKAFGDSHPITEWLKVAAKRAKPKGFVHFIVRTNRLPEIFSNVPKSLGSLVMTPIISRENQKAKLTILHAKKNGCADFMVSSPIVLHPEKKEASSKYVLEIENVLRKGTSLTTWI